MGDNATISGGENLGKNHNGETVHLVGVSGKGDNNTQKVRSNSNSKKFKKLKRRRRQVGYRLGL